MPQKAADRAAVAAIAGIFLQLQQRNRAPPCARPDGTLIESESHRTGELVA